MERLKVTGLTGGIGTGKSTVASYLREKGYDHVDADAIGRQIAEKGMPVLRELDDVFGPSGRMGTGKRIILEDGSLDRKALASIVFSDREKKDMLDSIMMKRIIAETDRQIEEYRRTYEEGRPSPGILLDAPLLFEAGLEDRCDEVILVTVELEERIRRVCERDGATPEEVRARISCQMGEDEKKDRSDIIVDNSGTLEDLHRQLENMLKKS